MVDMYGIRVRSGHCQVCLKRNGVDFYKNFGFNTWGGRDAALMHAIAWRDEIVRLHPPLLRREKAQRLISTNTSGIAGVFTMKYKGVVMMWGARTTIGSHKTVTKAFSIRRYGEQPAKAMAIAERQKQLGLLEGHVHLHPAEEVLRTAEPPLNPIPMVPPARRRHVLRRDNHSGVTGVSLVVLKGQPMYWMASTQLLGVVLKNTFSLTKHGYEQAKALAIEAREQQLIRLGVCTAEDVDARTACARSSVLFTTTEACSASNPPSGKNLS